MLGRSEQLLEVGIVTDRVPDWIEPQARDRNAFSGRHGKEPPKKRDSINVRTGVRFDFGQAREVSGAQQCIFLGRQKLTS